MSDQDLVRIAKQIRDHSSTLYKITEPDTLPKEVSELLFEAIQILLPIRGYTDEELDNDRVA